ncbi:hypothetical protein HZS_6616 [Henneguya salminicola]|nr:hypothetical protein HZS_6616 [Henneguya salminicola]
MVLDSAIQHLSTLQSKAGPRDGDDWLIRLKEEYLALIELVKLNKSNGQEWFSIESLPGSLKWCGKCWYYQDLKKYEFSFEFELPVSYPITPPEILIPSLDGKTAKMYRGGAICMTDHFMPLWSKNVPKFGIAHALVLGLAPWLAVEIPDLVSKNLI